MKAIEIENISKKFKVYHNRETNLKYVILNILKGKKAKLSSEFWALKDINIDIEKGKTIGFIGRNGSGKSTLLKLVSQILYPDGGTIETHGKISTLIELGAGFHPELTGRENVYINASILGLSRSEVNQRFKEIVHFSGLESFIDNPVKTYSSGMYVRLGFSVAINIDPDILLVDEVLAVGDESFQKKCIKKIQELKKAEKTIVFVSHDLQAVEELCDEVYLLHNGRVVKQGKPVEVISEYHKLLMGSSDLQVREEDTFLQDTAMKANSKNRWGSKEVEITSVVFLDKDGKETDVITTGEKFQVRINYNAHSKIENPVFGIAIYSDTGVHITGPNTKREGFVIESVEGKGFVQYEADSLPLMPGTYLFSAAIYDLSGHQAYDHWEQYWKFHVMESKTVTHRYGLISMPSRWMIEKN
ncbi:MAG: ABC transporter ATP-binding protein [Candidatus Aminicenantes bacterium]|nr:MAG: ABC transporter ATP-binding protein [Candidatus Aminicenantes bacterium]